MGNPTGAFVRPGPEPVIRTGKAPFGGTRARRVQYHHCILLLRTVPRSYKTMTCSEFIEGFSDYVDGVGEPAHMEAARAHLDACASCLRYDRTYRQGIDLLRSFPDVAVHDGFVPELDKRLRRDTALALEGLGRRPISSWSPVTMVLGMALVLVGAAWSPALLSRTVQVDLPPIQAQTPRVRALPLVRMPDISFLPPRARRPGGAFATAELWEEPWSLFRQYAPVMRGYAVGDTRLGID